MDWKVGKVKITKIVELETVGSTRFILPLAGNDEIRKLPWLIPQFATEEGRLPTPDGKPELGPNGKPIVKNLVEHSDVAARPIHRPGHQNCRISPAGGRDVASIRTCRASRSWRRR